MTTRTAPAASIILSALATGRTVQVQPRPGACDASDMETGRALGDEGGLVLVGWESGVRTLVDPADLVII